MKEKIPIIEPEIIVGKKKVRYINQRNKPITEKNVPCQRCHKNIAKYLCEVCSRKVCKSCWANGTCSDCCIEPSMDYINMKKKNLM